MTVQCDGRHRPHCDAGLRVPGRQEQGRGVRLPPGQLPARQHQRHGVRRATRGEKHLDAVIPLLSCDNQTLFYQNVLLFTLA